MGIQSPEEQPRVLFFDIETTGLKADFDHLLCCGFKFMDEKKPFVITIQDYPSKKPWDDSKLVKEIHKIINSADVIVSYYGRRFDIPFINSRLIAADSSKFLAIPDSAHVDLWQTARYKLKLHSNRLASIVEFLALHNQKTPVKGRHWMEARYGDRDALKYIVDHCAADVLALEEAYILLRPLISKHPRMRVGGDGIPSCPNCGSQSVQSRGYNVMAGALRKRRLNCQGCGHWFQGKAERKIPDNPDWNAKAVNPRR